MDYDRAWSSQEWKSEVTAHDRSRKLDKTSWSVVQQVRPHHGDTLLDGDAQSVRYGGMLRDRSGQPDNVNSQDGANSQNFIMGSDATEFVNRVNDEVRSRQKRMSNVADSGEEHSIIWRMFMAVTMNAATFMGKNFQDNQNSGEKHYGSQDPWRSVAGEDRSGRPDKGTDLFEASDHYFHEQFIESFSSTDYSKLDDDRAWSFQEWKTEATTYDRSGRPDNINSQEVARPQNFVIGNDEAELELSVESRSFVNRVNDQVRKRQKRISNVTEDGEKHSMIW